MTHQSNFCESHFQQLCLYELRRYATRLYGKCSIPMVPSLAEEKFLGFDAAFNFDWIGMPPTGGKYSGNLFLQFKIAHIHDGRSTKFSKEWSGQEHFRFDLFYYRKPSPTAPKARRDHSQLKALLQLAGKRYPVFYVSNELTEIDQVNLASEQGRLLWDSRWIDVRDFDKIYNYVSYRPAGDAKLHGSLRNLSRMEVRSLDSLRRISRTDASFQALMQDVAELIISAEQGLEESGRQFTLAWRNYEVQRAFLSPSLYLSQYQRAAHYLLRYYNLHWIILDG